MLSVDDHFREAECVHDQKHGNFASSALRHYPKHFNSIQFSFIYIAPNYNNCHLKALK